MRISNFTRAVVALNCAVPAVLLCWDAVRGELGANPVNFSIRTTGILSLIFLLLTLAVTPASRLSGWNWLGQFRRTLGLYAFFYALVHLLIFGVYDRAGSIFDTVSEIWHRRYLQVGFVGLAVMVPLAVTSTNRMIQKLGPRRWKQLHRLTYLAALAGALHFDLLVKSDAMRPIAFASVLGVLLGYRLLVHYLQLRQDSFRYRSAIPAKPSAAPRVGQWEGLLRVARIFEEADGIRTFRLVDPAGGRLPFEYQPGQYLNLTVDFDGARHRRSYTLASSPSRPSYCEITVKREDNGLVSRHLHDRVREGELLQIRAPAGRFTFTGVEAKSIVLIAGGVGITPLMSKIRYLTDTCWPGTITLVISARTEASIAFRGELHELQKRFANFTAAITLTREPGPGWSGNRGRITADFLKAAVPDLQHARFHLCGPTEMTTPVIAILKELDVPEESIRVESFRSPSRQSSDAPAQQSVAASLEPELEGSYTLAFRKSGKTISETGGRTVLELAEEHGVALPYDCRSGICGQCKVPMISGSVSMDAEDALDSSDRAKGLILACQARCREDVVIDA